MSARSNTVPRALSFSTPPRWLLGWWGVGRLAAIGTALALKPSVWTLDRWDGHWYRMVAHSGYLLVPGRQSDPAFFPLYPILLRILHSAGLGWGVVGPLVSNLAFLLGLGLFYLLSREIFSEPLARRATIYLAIFPLSYVFSMSYPESLVLVLLTAAPLAALRRHWWLAVFCAGAAALARPEGLFLVLPLGAIAWQQRHTLSPAARGAALGAVLAPIAAVASYSLYLATVLSDPLAWSQAERAWGRQFRLSGAYEAFVRLPTVVGHTPWLVRDVVCFFVYLALLYAAGRAGAPLPWLAAAAAIVVLPIFTGAFDSMGRFGLLAPPLFWGLAELTKSPRAQRLTCAVLLALLVLGTASLTFMVP